MTEAQRKHALINIAGLAIFPIGDDAIASDKKLEDAKTLWEKFPFALHTFDEKVAEIQHDVRLTQAGRQDAMRRLGEESFASLNRIEPYIEKFKQAVDAVQPSKALLKPIDPNDAAAAVRAFEIRLWLREAGNAESVLRLHGGVDGVLIDAASKGQMEVVAAILNAPAGMFKVTEKNSKFAEKLLAERLNPEGTKRLSLLTDAWEALERIRNGVRAHISKISGVRDPLVPMTARTPLGEVEINSPGIRP